MAKTNAARILESHGIAFELRDYEHSEDLSAEAVAAKVGLPNEQVFKTLLARGDRRGPLFAVIPAGTTLDLRVLARLSGNRRVELVPLKEVQPLTGYVRGGVTVLGAKKDFPTYVDETAEVCDLMAVSAGTRGTQILLAGGDYVRATRATTGPIARAD